MPLSRRQFLGQTALAAGTAFLPRNLRAMPAAAPDIFRAGLTVADFNADLITRTAPARARFKRIAEFINRGHSSLRKKIIADAEQAMLGLLLLPGSAALSSVGVPPAWEIAQHGDEEFLWSLNRMMHWKTLLQAWALTGESRYADKVVSELDDWIATVRQPLLRAPDGEPDPRAGTDAGGAPWRQLELGIRMFDSWPAVLEQLAGTSFLPPDRLARLAGSLVQHGETISLLSPRLWPEANHNHYFMEMLGLLAIGVNARELASAGAWSDQAIRELQRCAEKQFTADGGHIEACPSYHNICVVLLARYLDLAAALGRKLPERVHALVAKSGEQTLHSTRPTGQIVPWGDSSRSNQVEAALWMYRATGELGVLQHLTGLMGLERVQADAAPHLWDLDDPVLLFEQMKLAASPRSLVRFDRGNDQVMARTSWKRDALSVFFSCHSPLVPGSGHQHIDLGGFDFTAYGKTVVVDPGVYTYREIPERKMFKDAPFHSVLMIDGKPPFEYLSRWRYSPQKEGRVTKVQDEPGLLRVESFHRNYAPAICRRTLALVDDRLLVVIDSVEAIAPTSTVQIYFHLDSQNVIPRGTEGCTLADNDEVKLALYSAGGLKCDLLPGQISEAFDTARPSTCVRFSDQGGAANRVYATVLLPFRAGREPEPVRDLTVSAATRACEFTQAGRKFSVRFG